MRTIKYNGLLCLHGWGEAYDILFLSSVSDPFADELEYKIKRKKVTARYWITDKPCSKEEANEDFMKIVMGLAETDFGSHYSEYTGYLWTDEECKIGGHDLIKELKQNIGKWLILEIEIH